MKTRSKSSIRQAAKQFNMQLHETRMGRKLIEGDLPRAIDALNRIAEALEKLEKPASNIEYNIDKTDTSWDG